ncbi:MAG: TetR/AcrR family transcriptional regulator [Candidatus Omnitrophica bacterium]|nr:TetR/AcrR family transcriptional regulator [Candidatus Omnitrophota bacterium]
MRTKDKAKIQALIKTRKAQILDAAMLVFSRDGFNKASTDEIANVAKLGKGTVYRYFKDKKELFIATVDRGLDRLKDSILAKVDGIDDPLERIEAGSKAYLTFFGKNPALIDMMIHEQSEFKERIKKQYFEHYYGSIDRMRRIFRKGITGGLIKNVDVDTAISILTNILNGQIYMWRVEGKKGFPEDKISVILKIFFTGVIKDEKRRQKYE